MVPTVPAPRTRVRTVFRYLLGLLLVFTGHGHLTWARTMFQAQVPAWVPMSPDRVVALSGVVELGLGAALILARRQPLVGWIAAAFFVAIFPGNVAQYVNRVNAFGLNSDATRLARLFLHPVLVAWPLWSTGAWQTRPWRRES